MTDPHAAFLQDPEGNAAHLERCDACRALVQTLESPLSAAPVEVGKLPLAAWEGAAYRSWGFVAVTSAIVAAMAIVLCHMAGVSPLHAVAADTGFSEWRALLGALNASLSSASLGWQILFGCAFVVVNTVLVLLLRRPPRGIDA